MIDRTWELSLKIVKGCPNCGIKTFAGQRHEILFCSKHEKEYFAMVDREDTRSGLMETPV